MLLSVWSSDLSPFYSTGTAASRIVAPSPRPGVITSSKKDLLPQGDNTFLYAESKHARVSSVPYHAMPSHALLCPAAPFRIRDILVRIGMRIRIRTKIFKIFHTVLL